MIALAQASAAAPVAGIDMTLVRAFLGLLFVLALVTGLAVLVRRGVIALPGRRGHGGLTIESSLPLGDRRFLLVVSVEGRRLLLGSTPSGVTLVTELAAAPFDRALARASGSPAGGAS